MVRTMVRMNALDLSDQRLLDEYAIITECELYKAFFHDDFKWNQVRSALKDSIRTSIATFPMNYHYDLKMQLDRYDFATKFFRFTKKSLLNNINTFVLYSVEGTGCGMAEVQYIPRTYRAVVSSPLYLEGLPLTDKDARDLLARMDKDENISRIIYARFNLRTVYVEPLRKTAGRNPEGVDDKYVQSRVPEKSTVRLDVHLDSIGFYEDPQMTRLIYMYQP
jgi:hypothetical protein